MALDIFEGLFVVGLLLLDPIVFVVMAEVPSVKDVILERVVVVGQ